MSLEKVYRIPVPATERERAEAWRDVISELGGHAEVVKVFDGPSSRFVTNKSVTAIPRLTHTVAVVEGAIVDLTTEQRVFDTLQDYVEYLKGINPSMSFSITKGGL